MKTIKRIGFAAVLTALLSLPVFGQSFNDIEKAQGAYKDLADIFNKALIFNSTLGLNWSEAYIGPLINAPPHFGVGISAGATTIKTKDLDSFLTAMGTSIEDSFDGKAPPYLPVPGAYAELRVGGFFLPFDLGFKVLPMPAIDVGSTTIKYFSIGGDVRYALLKDKGPVPGLSIGLGVNHLSGSVSTNIDVGTGGELDLDPLLNEGTGVRTIKFTDPDLDIHWNTTVLDLKVQISKKIFIITPYLGLGASYGWSTVGYDVKGGITPGGTGGHSLADTLTEINSALAGLGLPGLDSLSASKLGVESKYSGFAFRAYGGLSFNIAVIRLDLNGLYNIGTNNFGASFGLRFQL